MTLLKFKQTPNNERFQMIDGFLNLSFCVLLACCDAIGIGGPPVSRKSEEYHVVFTLLLEILDPLCSLLPREKLLTQTSTQRF